MAAGRHEIAHEHLTKAVALIESGRAALGAHLVPGAMLSWTLVELDDVDAAVACALTARQTAERRGAVALMPMCIAATAAALTTPAAGTTHSQKSTPRSSCAARSAIPRGSR